MCADLEAVIKESTHTMGQRILKRVKRRQWEEEEEAGSEEEEERGGIVYFLNN